MSKPYRLVAVLLVAGAVLFGIFRSGDRGSRRPESPETEATQTEDSATPEGRPRQAAVSIPAEESSLPVPERLQDPRALDPEPLQLTFARPPFERRNDGRIFKTDEVRRAADLHRDESAPEEDLQILDAVIASYRTIFRQNPIAGENREVVEALTGKNPYRLVFLDPGHPALNEQSELTDRWGTPYRFHPLSGTRMEISSAGADRHFGTADDVLLDESAGGDGADRQS